MALGPPLILDSVKLKQNKWLETIISGINLELGANKIYTTFSPVSDRIKKSPTF